MRSERDNATIREILDHIDLAENFGKGRSFAVPMTLCRFTRSYAV